jgi:DNA-binding beta-propeller fold protein YncE
VPAPQGVAYSPETNKLFVVSDEGKLFVYDGTTFDLIKSIGDEVDTFAMILWRSDYTSASETKRGVQIGVVDVATNQRLDDVSKLGAHPESFQLSATVPNIYVNLPDLKQIAVVNRGTHQNG